MKVKKKMKQIIFLYPNGIFYKSVRHVVYNQ